MTSTFDRYAATKSALERTARRVAPETARRAAREATRALGRAKARATRRADAFEKWACEHARDVLRHVVVNLAHNVAARAHAEPPPVRGALDDSSDSEVEARLAAAEGEDDAAAEEAAPRRRFVVGRVGVRDFTLELYDCPVTLDRCFVGARDLALDAALLAEYGLAPSAGGAGYTAGEVLLACAEKLIETLLIDHPTLALNLAAALSRDLVQTKTAAAKPLKRRFLAHHRRARRVTRRRARAPAASGWLAWLREGA